MRLEELRWRAILGQEGNAALYGLSSLLLFVVGAFVVETWPAVAGLQCVTDSPCTVALDDAVRAAIGLMLWLGGSLGLLAVAWRDRPRRVGVVLGRFTLDVGAEHIVLAEVGEVGRYQSSVVLAMRDGELRFFEVGDDRLASEIAVAVRRRVQRIERVPDPEAKRAIRRLEGLSST